MGLGSRSQKGTGSRIRIRNTALKQKTSETIFHKLDECYSTVHVTGVFFPVEFWLGAIFPPLANINVGRTYYS
jgi:hypothetical protein